MKFLSVITLVVLCVGVARSEGGSEGGSQIESRPLDQLLGMLASLEIGGTCTELAGMGCMIQSAACYNIPGVSCDDFTASCYAGASALCDCVDNCAPTCLASGDCTGLEGDHLTECKVANGICIAQCTAMCPVTEMTRVAMESMTAITQLVTQLQALMGGLQPTTEH